MVSKDVASCLCGVSLCRYEQAIRDEERANRAAIAHFTKPCPQCKVPTEKNNGCNHMTCRGCGQDWCWICGRKCDGGGYPTHYAWWNIFGCPGTQMQDRYQHWSCCGQCGLRCGLFLYKLCKSIPRLTIVVKLCNHTERHTCSRERIVLVTSLPVAVVLVLVVVPAAALALAVAIACLPGLLISVPMVYCCCDDEFDDDEENFKFFVMVFVSIQTPVSCPCTFPPTQCEQKR